MLWNRFDRERLLAMLPLRLPLVEATKEEEEEVKEVEKRKMR